MNRIRPSASGIFILLTFSIYLVFTQLISCSKDEPSIQSFPKCQEGPQAGNPDGKYAITPEAGLVDISKPDHIVGNGTPESCTSEAFLEAVAKGGTIVFNSGGKPVTIFLSETAKIFNNANPDVVIDGAGLVTLSGKNAHRILYMNTCDQALVWTTSHCQNQDHPRMVVQNLTFVQGNSKSDTQNAGGGAIWVRGGRFKAVNCRFFNNVCGESGPDLGGACIRVTSQFENLPVFITNCTFGGAKEFANSGSNGGALSSINVSWTIINSLFSHNIATGNGGNPAQEGTPGGGSGGAVYNDGNTMTLTLLGSKIEYNEVNAYGSAIFFVSNNHTGNIVIKDSYIKNNIGGSWYTKYKGISAHSDTPIQVENSVFDSF